MPGLPIIEIPGRSLRDEAKQSPECVDVSNMSDVYFRIPILLNMPLYSRDESAFAFPWLCRQKLKRVWALASRGEHEFVRCRSDNAP